MGHILRDFVQGSSIPDIIHAEVNVYDIGVAIANGISQVLYTTTKGVPVRPVDNHYMVLSGEEFFIETPHCGVSD